MWIGDTNRRRAETSATYSCPLRRAPDCACVGRCSPKAPGPDGVKFLLKVRTEAATLLLCLIFARIHSQLLQYLDLSRFSVATSIGSWRAGDRSPAWCIGS